MTYTPKTWNCEDQITISDMNRIENGVAQMGSGGYLEPLIISFDHYEGDTSYMDTTWQQAYDAYMEGRPIIVDAVDPAFSGYIYKGIVTEVWRATDDSDVNFIVFEYGNNLYANLPTDYLFVNVGR